MTTSPVDPIEKIEEGLYHYLLGYGQGRPENLEQIIAYAQWQQHARREADRRLNGMLEWLDMPTLIAIADGLVDLRKVAQRALNAQ
jgi:hypothetical protein